MNTRSIALWTFAYGVAWNLFGWLGNAVLLGDAWDAVGAGLAAGWSPPWQGVAHEAMTIVSDFVYAFAFVWLFARSADRTATAAVRLVIVVWLAGAAMTYLAIVNAGFLPWPIAAKTGALALVIFVVTAPLLPRLASSGNQRT